MSLRRGWIRDVDSCQSSPTHLLSSGTLTTRGRFIHAPHSRARLKITREMLMLSLTFFQVMPEFLDFLFPLGERVLAQDFYCSGFKQQTRLAGITDGLRIPERGWSGCNLQICYSLKSVERSPTQTDWPWSIRHCAAHHAFDVENVRSSWIVVKGDQLMETRVKSATISRGPPEFSSFGTVESAFAAALATHLILCDWSVEGWRWYIDFLVDMFEELTQDTISANVDVPTSLLQNGDLFSLGPPTGIQATNQTQRSSMSSLPRQLRSHRQRTDTLGTITEKEPTYPQSLYTNPRSGKKQPLPPGKTMSNLQESKRTPIQYDMYGQQQFSFQDLQDIQDIEERACEAVLVLKLNQTVIRQLADFYRSIFDNMELPQVIIKNCRVAMVRFDRRIHGLEKDMNSQTLRIETLMRLIGDRKTLVSKSKKQDQRYSSLLTDWLSGSSMACLIFKIPKPAKPLPCNRANPRKIWKL